MKQVSVFHKGITTDLDYSKLDNTGLLLPTANIQLLNKDGQGLIVTPVKGNEEVFELTPGFQLLGATEYNGIAYIVSYNPSTNVGEIGSFPSPSVLGGTFEENYKPLKNINHVDDGDEFSAPIEIGLPMRSSVFDFDLEHPIGDQFIALRDYDGTVNLIFTDNKNVLRLVNTGFDQDGNFKTGRFYNTETLKKAIQLIKELPSKQMIEFTGESSGGQLKFGNYFFFYRYADASNNRTEFVSESQPIFITKTHYNSSSVKTTGLDENSTKKINLKVDNLDNSFTYIEFAFIRYLSAGEGSAYPEVMRIDKLFAIPQNGGELEVEINGFETQVPFDISEILRPVNRETICKSILSHDRRIWGGNWRAEPINYNALQELALKIRLGFDDTKTIPHWELRNFYSDPDNLRYSGYFRGEAYITGAVFVLNSGYKTERFPVKGIDARMLTMDELSAAHDQEILTNEHGVIVMPQNKYSPYLENVQHEEGDRGWGRILALSFDMTKAKEWLSASGQYQTWIKENVKEIIFVRAKRKENLVYQGVMSRVYGRKMYKYLDTDEPYENNGVSIPIISDYTETNLDDACMPVVDRFAESKRTFGALAGHINRQYQGITIIKDAQSEEEKLKRAVFSSDYIFGEKDAFSDGDAEVYIKTEGLHTFEEISVANVAPNKVLRNFQYVNWSNPSVVLKVDSVTNVYDENNFILPTNAKDDFVNKVEDLGADDSPTVDTSRVLFWDKSNTLRLVNRNIIVPPYLGFNIPEKARTATALRFPGRIISFYRQNPDLVDGVTVYSDELNLNYFSIDREKYDLLAEDLQDRKVCYQGDCFIQLVTIKTRTWEPTLEIGNIDGEDSVEVGADISAIGFGADLVISKVRYAHGQLFDIVTENKINAALRMSAVDETLFYPAIKNRTIEQNGETFTLYPWEWAVYPYTTEVRGWEKELGTGVESYLINPANNKTISINSYLSYNPFFPKGLDAFPNRIRYTGQQEANYPVLAYRLWNYLYKEDFEERFGEMTRIELAYGRLVSIQENAIFMHYTNREETVPSSSGEMVIGVRSILSKEPIVLARYGSQHIFAVKNTKSGVYGWDWMNGVIWRIQINQEGNLFSTPLHKEELIENYLRDLKFRKDGNDLDSVLTKLEDKMLLDTSQQEGIVIGYDKKMDEVLFTCAFNGESETMRFNENIGDFIGTFGFPAKFYFGIHNDFYSVRAMPHNIRMEEKVYLHAVGLPARFYGTYYSPVISFIVNGFLSAEEIYVNIDKLYKAIEIESPRNPLPIDKILFQTMFQKGRNEPFHNEIEFWLTPEYLMSKWAAPINIAHEGQEQFYVESNMSGKWLKVTIVLNKGVDTFIKNVVTNFITSHA